MSPVVVLVAIGAGAAGALARYGVSRAVGARFRPEHLPRAVLIVNIVASAIAGAMIGATASSPELRYILVSGFAGGLSTFSTWAVETVQLVLDGKTGAAVRNVAANLGWGLVAAIAAALAASAITTALA